MLKIGALTRACSARKAAGCLPSGAQSRRAGPKPKKIGVRHGVLGPWAPGMRHAGNVAPFNTGGTEVEPDVETRQN